MITKDDVKYIANLSQLELSEAELATMQEQLSHILGYVEQLKELDPVLEKDQVPPMMRAIEGAAMVLRKDEVKSSLDKQSILKECVHVVGDSFAVPKVIES